MLIKKSILMILVLAPVFLAGCGIDELPPPPRRALPPPRIPVAAPPPAKVVPARFSYHGDVRRDPFIALNGEGTLASASSEEVVIPNLSSLTLKGIFNDGKTSIAVISGGGITYMLRDHRLYDNHQRLVRGISGIIKVNSVTLIAADHTSKELKMHEKLK